MGITFQIKQLHFIFCESKGKYSIHLNFKGLYKKDHLWRIVMYFLLIVFLMSTVEKRAREWWTGDWESSKGDVLAVGKSHLSHCVLGIRVSYHLLTLLLEDFQQIRIVFWSSVLWEAYCRWKYINTSSHFLIHFHILCLIKLYYGNILTMQNGLKWKVHSFLILVQLPRANCFQIFQFYTLTF